MIGKLIDLVYVALILAGVLRLIFGRRFVAVCVSSARGLTWKFRENSRQNPSAASLETCNAAPLHRDQGEASTVGEPISNPALTLKGMGSCIVARGRKYFRCTQRSVGGRPVTEVVRINRVGKPKKMPEMREGVVSDVAGHLLI